jgi:hypothetical protein
MATVEIDGNDYDAYADQEEADLYLAASLSADSWRAAEDDVKGMALVTATRLLDRQSWVGEKNVSNQTLAWPRKDTGVEGVADAVIPQDIINGTIELASALIDGSEAQTAQTTAQTIQSLRAGSVSISYFRGAEGVALRFPLPVQEYLGKYLTGKGSQLVGAISSGTDGCTVTGDRLGYVRGL